MSQVNASSKSRKARIWYPRFIAQSAIKAARSMSSFGRLRNAMRCLRLHQRQNISRGRAAGRFSTIDQDVVGVLLLGDAQELLQKYAARPRAQASRLHPARRNSLIGITCTSYGMGSPPERSTPVAKNRGRRRITAEPGATSL